MRNALIVLATKEVKAIATNGTFKYAADDIEAGLKKIVPADNWDQTSMNFWQANDANDGIEPKLKLIIDELQVKENLRKARNPNTETELLQYAAIIKKGQNYADVKTYINGIFPDPITEAQRTFLAKLTHIVALAVRATRTSSDDMFNSDE